MRCSDVVERVLKNSGKPKSRRCGKGTKIFGDPKLQCCGEGTDLVCTTKKFRKAEVTNLQCCDVAEGVAKKSGESKSQSCDITRLPGVPKIPEIKSHKVAKLRRCKVPKLDLCPF